MVEAKIDPEKKVMFLLMFLFLVGAIYGTYAYFSANSESESQEVTTGTMDISFDDTSPILRNENIVPISESDVLTKATKKTFTISNTGNISVNASISLVSIEITEALKHEDFKWALYENDTKIAENNFSILGTNTSMVLIDNVTIEPNSPKTYNLYIWIQETNIPQDNLQGGHLSSIISVSGVQQ